MSWFLGVVCVGVPFFNGSSITSSAVQYEVHGKSQLGGLDDSWILQGRPSRISVFVLLDFNKGAISYGFLADHA